MGFSLGDVDFSVGGQVGDYITIGREGMESIGDTTLDIILNPLEDPTSTILDPFQVFQDQLDIFTDALEESWRDVVLPSFDLLTESSFTFTETYLQYKKNTFGLLNYGDDLKWAEDMNGAMRWLGHEAVKGNYQAIRMIATIIVSVLLTVFSAGALSGQAGGAIGAILGTVAGSMTAAQVVVVVSYIAYTLTMIASTIYGIYSLALSVADLGRMIEENGLASTMSSLNQSLKNARAAMDLAFVNGFINGSMNLWMAGGLLYDAPRAGGLMFNPSGNMNTTKFLNMQETNQNEWYKWTKGNKADLVTSNYGSLAGHTFFSVAPIA